MDLPACSADFAAEREDGVRQKGGSSQAAAEYNRIGAVVSFPPTMDSVAAVVQRCRSQINPSFDVELRLAEGAFDAMAAGDAERHNRLLYETALQLAHGKEAIVLSQMSHMRALPLFADFPVPVLTSPPVSLGLLCDMIEAK